MTATVHLASEILKLKTGRVTLFHKSSGYVLSYTYHCYSDPCYLESQLRLPRPHQKPAPSQCRSGPGWSEVTCIRRPQRPHVPPRRL